MTETDTPRIGIVIPAYEAEDFIAAAIRSALDQATPPAVVVVVDDGSPDGTVAAARATAKAVADAGDGGPSAGPEVLVLTGPNRGACHARNRGAEAAVAAGATHLLFLDADDVIEGDYLGAATEAAADGADILLGRVVRRRDGETVHVREVAPADLDPETAFAGWLTGPQINPAGMVFRAGFLDRVGGWREDVLINQDAELVLRGLLLRPRMAAIPRGHGVYHLGHPSLSSRHSEAKLANYVGTLSRLLSSADAAGFGARTGGIEDTLYGVARMSFRNGWTETGRAALGVLRSRGDGRHRGNLVHRVAAGVLGLERKVRLFERGGVSRRNSQAG